MAAWLTHYCLTTTHFPSLPFTRDCMIALSLLRLKGSGNDLILMYNIYTLNSQLLLNIVNSLILARFLEYCNTLRFEGPRLFATPGTPVIFVIHLSLYTVSSLN